MEKLRELLNEFDPYIAKDWEHRDNLWYGVICWESAVYWKENWIQKIISKEYGFIQRLVENNRIDIERLHKIVDYILVMKGNYVNAHDYNSDCLLMLLAISDTPIEDLISYLK
jgi:hypothetical protein